MNDPEATFCAILLALICTLIGISFGLGLFVCTLLFVSGLWVGFGVWVWILKRFF